MLNSSLLRRHSMNEINSLSLIFESGNNPYKLTEWLLPKSIKCKNYQLFDSKKHSMLCFLLTSMKKYISIVNCHFCESILFSAQLKIITEQEFLVYSTDGHQSGVPKKIQNGKGQSSFENCFLRQLIPSAGKLSISSKQNESYIKPDLSYWDSLTGWCVVGVSEAQDRRPAHFCSLFLFSNKTQETFSGLRTYYGVLQSIAHHAVQTQKARARSTNQVDPTSPDTKSILSI